MRAVIQRVNYCSVTVANACVGKIGRGLLILLGVKRGDTRDETVWLAEKCMGLRIFEDEQGKFNRSLSDIAGEIMVVSQFTLYGDCRRGRRPGFTDAAEPGPAEQLYELFKQHLSNRGIPVSSGRFGGQMAVELVNDGPVTLIIDTEER